MVLKMKPKSKEEFDLNFQKTRELLDGKLNLFMKSFWMNNISKDLRSNYLKSLQILFKLINNFKTSKWPLYVDLLLFINAGITFDKILAIPDIAAAQ